jgi:hypothetical protein
MFEQKLKDLCIGQVSMEEQVHAVCFKIKIGSPVNPTAELVIVEDFSVDRCEIELRVNRQRFRSAMSFGGGFAILGLAAIEQLNGTVMYKSRVFRSEDVRIVFT